MNIWILFLVVFLKGQPVVEYKPFNTQAECEVAKTQAQAQVIRAGSTSGSLTCFETKIGDFS
jgi:hypothetical protein